MIWDVVAARITSSDGGTVNAAEAPGEGSRILKLVK